MQWKLVYLHSHFKLWKNKQMNSKEITTATREKINDENVTNRLNYRHQVFQNESIRM